MNIITINPQYIRLVSINSSEYLMQRYGTENFLAENKTGEIVMIECLSSTTGDKPVLLPQPEIGSLKISDAFFTKIVSLKNVGATVLYEDDDYVYVSMLELQEIAHDSIIDTCREHGCIEAEIIHIVRFGAYVMVLVSQGEGDNEIVCFKTYLLRNINFSKDHTPVSKIHHRGDFIKLCIRSEEEAGMAQRILIEAFNKYENQNKADIDKFKTISTAIGKVTAMKPRMTFVTIDEGVDALVTVNPDCQNIQVGSKVVVSHIKVSEKEDQLKVSGVITSILDY